MNIETALKEYLERKGINLKTGSQSFVTDCINPNCGKEVHLYIRRSSGQSICFKCITKWDWRGLVAQIEHCKREDSWNVLFGGGSNGETETQREDLFDDVFNQQQKVKDKPIHFLGPDFIPVEKSVLGLEYLESRGVVSPQTIIDFDIRWHGGMKAVVFPIRRGGVLYGWQARRIDPKEGELRLLSFAGMSKSRHLLNYDIASQKDNIFIVEGPFDAIKVAQAGFGGVATLGKQVSLEQIRMVMESPCSRIYNGLDPDAFQEVYELNSKLGLGKKIFRVIPPDGREDFGECSIDEIKKAVEDAIEVSSPSDVLEVYFN
jgi:hypothetical protein